MTEVVIAGPEFEAGVWESMKGWLAENALFPADEGKCRFLLRRCLTRDAAVCGVIGTPDKVEASIALTASDIWYSSLQESLIMVSQWQYVAPEYRKGGHSNALMEFANTVGQALGMSVVLSEYLPVGVDPKRKIAYFKRRLGEESFVGGIFVAGPKPAMMVKSVS